MSPKYKIPIAILLIFVTAAIVAAVVNAKSLNAPDSGGNLRGLLETLTSGETQVTIQFGIPLTGGERTWIVPDKNAGRQIAEIGDDYVCFSEPWNNGVRRRCTPLSNVVSISYVPTAAAESSP